MASSSSELPFQPIRNTLYGSPELMRGYDPDDPDSMARTFDFESYRYYIRCGGSAVIDPYAGMMEALHDNSILRAMTGFIADAKRPTVAIMGGHNLQRDSIDYRSVVDIARKLTIENCLVASGGGPGAMEATHLGALLAEASDSEVEDAIDSLKAYPKLPNSKAVLSKDGEQINTQILRELHAWVRPAHAISLRYANGPKSLAVPTWYYGDEPISPFASHFAKYFQNSIREDVLLSIAANGIIYTRGAAGTLQEVFQDAAQNYYPKEGETFAPMIFFGKQFWTEELPVLPVLQSLFIRIGKRLSEADFGRYIKIVDTVDEAVSALLSHGPTEEKTANRMMSLGFGPMMDQVRSLRLDSR
jgi:predicted Rossmann-fold nucleotide-binding protein